MYVCTCMYVCMYEYIGLYGSFVPHSCDGQDTPALWHFLAQLLATGIRGAGVACVCKAFIGLSRVLHLLWMEWLHRKGKGHVSHGNIGIGFGCATSNCQHPNLQAMGCSGVQETNTTPRGTMPAEPWVLRRPPDISQTLNP